MKRTMLLVFLLVLSGCVSTGPKKSAIEAVFQQRAEVKAVYSHSVDAAQVKPAPRVDIFGRRSEPQLTPNNIQELGDYSRQLVAGLKAINVQNCPEDFRAAWFDYLVDVEDTNTKHVRLAQLALQNGRNEGDLSSLAKLVGAALTYQANPLAAAGMLASIEPIRSGDKNFAVAQQMLDAQHRLDESWRKLQRIAMNYGVMPER